MHALYVDNGSRVGVERITYPSDKGEVMVQVVKSAEDRFPVGKIVTVPREYLAVY